jgi:hypothetical protein
MSPSVVGSAEGSGEAGRALPVQQFRSEAARSIEEHALIDP